MEMTLAEKPTALNEKGQEVKGVGDMPNEHDMLTGSRLARPDPDRGGSRADGQQLDEPRRYRSGLSLASL